MRYLINFSYIGTKYIGWQHQKNFENTVQFILEKKLKILLKTTIVLKVAGRTDKGVHANEQVAHFDIEHSVDLFRVSYQLNALLTNEDIVINYMKEVSLDFHARYSCIEKEYKYYFAFKKNLLFTYYWKVQKLDIGFANECAKLLTGSLDFSSFRDKDCQAVSPIRTINSFDFQYENNFIVATIKSKSFLHHQIRIMIGTIYQLYSQNKQSDEILKILENKSRKKAGITAPAIGLFLNKITYPANHLIA